MHRFLRPVGRFSAVLAAIMVSMSTHAALAQEDSTPVASRLSEARTPDGQYISWREHIIDNMAVSGVPVSGSDGLVMGDLDGDGYEDIVSVHESDTEYDGVARGHVRIAFGSEDPDVWILTTLAEDAEAGAAEDAAIGDVNGDGYPDIIAACELAHLIYFQNPGKNVRTTRWERLILPMTKDRGSFIRVFLADFNADGQLEAVAPNKGEQNPGAGARPDMPISIFEVMGDPLSANGWVEHELGRYPIPQNSRPVDLDGDGDLDVLGGVRGENRILWFENKGGAKFNFVERAIEIEGGATGGFNFAFEDLSGDGRIDVVVLGGAALGTDLAWIEQPVDFSDVWKYHPIGTMRPDLAVGIALADVNGDGNSDLIAGSYSRGPRDEDGGVTRNTALGRIAWFEHPSDSRAEWTRHDISRRKRGMFDKFLPRDMDGDGDMDFVSTRGNSNPYDGVFWLEQVRTSEPRPVFQRARESDSEEMPLPMVR